MKRETALLAACLLFFAWLVPAQAATEHFTDVDADTAVGAAIYEMVEAGCISGVSAGEFRPDEPISAADYIVMIGRQKRVQAADTAAYMQAALDAGWYDWDQIPPDNPASAAGPVSRELGANIVVAAYFGRGISYDYNTESAKISDFAAVSGRYYFGVLGGLSRGIFDHVTGTSFHPRQNLTRGDACLWVANAARSSAGSAQPTAAPRPTPTPERPAAAGGVAQNGWLQVKGTRLLNESGQPVVLHGMSSHGIQWFPQYTSRQSIENTVSRGANVFRVAMYVEQDGYIQQPQRMTQLVDEAVRNAAACGIYVIIDWHILQDGNPLTHADAAADFFAKMSARYADCPNVIYEICNEPNGNITWSGDVKPYAERMVGVIRENAPRSVILIGSPTWDQDVEQAAADPVAGTNLMYTLHFYAGTHYQDLREKADRALALGAPLFVSEWGLSAADGSGGIYPASADAWLEWMDRNGLSWCNWSLCDKDESSAALLPGTPADIVWTEANLSGSGRYVFARFRAESSPAPGILTTAEVLQQFGVPAGLRGEISKNGEVLGADAAVSTGCELTLRDAAGTVVESRTVAVMGDVLGSGRITIAQLVAVARSLNGQQPLAGPYLAAADFTGTGQLSISDLVAEARLLTSPSPLTCRFLPRDS